MKNKYYILVLTFLCLMVGQNNYGQSSGDDYDYSNIDNFISQMLEANPNIDVHYYTEVNDYVDAVNSDDNPNNDFTDTNGDGQINTDDDLYRQNLINLLGDHISDFSDLSNADLLALLNAVSNGTQLDDINITREQSLMNKIGEILNASGVSSAEINTAMLLSDLNAYATIMITTNSDCNNTPGGCQSWFHSNYIGATTSSDKAEIQRQNGIEPIDAVDLAAFNHDVAYDHAGAAGADSAVFDLNTLPADKELLAACYDVEKMYFNGEIDPQTGEPVSLATFERAYLVINAFEIIVAEKEARN